MTPRSKYLPTGGRSALLWVSAALLLFACTAALRAQTALRTSVSIHTDGAYVVLSGANLQLDSGGELPGNGTWRFEGSTVQTLANNSGGIADIPNAELDNPGGLLLAGDPIHISGNFDFANGIVDALTNNLHVEFGDAGSHSSAGPASHVEGPVRKSGSTAFVFPTGQDGIYAPARRTASPSGTYEVRYHENASPNAGPYYDGSNFPVSTCEYWEFNRIAGSSNPRMYFTYENNACNAVSDFNFLDLVWWNSFDWDPVVGIDPSTTEIGSTADLPDSWTGQYTLSSFNANFNVLPIELLRFDARAVDNSSVLLTWSTASETNNDFFTLERSIDAQDWKNIGEVQGAGNSNVELHYTFYDRNPRQGLAYYRLRQTDFDGSSELSEVKSVYIRVPGNEPELFPPYRLGSSLRARVNGLSRPATAEVYDLLGKRVAEMVTITAEDNEFQIPLSVARGVYVLRIRHAGQALSRKFFW